LTIFLTVPTGSCSGLVVVPALEPGAVDPEPELIGGAGAVGAGVVGRTPVTVLTTFLTGATTGPTTFLTVPVVEPTVLRTTVLAGAVDSGEAVVRPEVVDGTLDVGFVVPDVGLVPVVGEAVVVGPPEAE
jgi:hypothetical protein